jgi:hypothetical protein
MPDDLIDHEAQLEKLVTPLETGFPPAKARELSNAIYAFDELRLWPEDIEIKSNKLAIRIWALVEHVRQNGFPENLKL